MNLQITVSKSELQNKLKAVSRVINPSNKINPAWDNFLFEIGSELKVTAACESGNITAKIDCEFQAHEKQLSFMADAKTMLDGLKKLSEQPLKLCFDTDSYSFEIYHEYGRYKVHASDANFQTLQVKSADSKLITVDANNFIFGLSSVVKFAGNDDLRPMINAVYVGIDQNTITFCASDSHTLSELKIISENAFEKSDLTLPQKLVKLLIDLIESEEITVEFTNNHICIVSSCYTIVYRQIEGKYFNYKSIIPKGNDKILTVNTRLIQSCISRVSVFSNKATNLIALSVKENKLKFSCQDNDYDQLAEETIPVEYNSSERFEIGFNANFLLKCIEEITSEEVVITFSDPTRAALIIPKDEDIEKTILIMPIMINT